MFHNLRRVKCADGGVYRVAAAVVGAGVGGALLSGNASKKAANTQANAANNAADLQAQATAQAREDLMPFTEFGKKQMNPLLAAMGYNPDGSINQNSMLHQKFSFNPSDLTKTPGYQLALDQGMRQVNNSAAARGLGLSGAQLKGATGFATGLADQTYQNQFNNALNTFNTNYNTASNNANNLSGLVQMGQNSAAGQASTGMAGAANQGNLLTQAGNANAAGQIGQANAYSGALNNMGGMYATNSLLKNNNLKGFF